MKKKIIALTLAALMLFPAAVLADTPAGIDPAFPNMYASAGIELDYTVPISRAAFSLLTFEAFRSINGGVFPQMEAKNIFSDIGQEPEDMFVVMLYGMGIVNGVNDDTFEPRRTITRQEACTMLTRAKLRQNPDMISDIEASKDSITGVPGAEETALWGIESIAYLYAKGAFTLKNGSLAPNDALTTEEAMLLCTAYINIK